MLKKKEKYVVAVVGATGAVGEEMISILEAALNAVQIVEKLTEMA